MKKLFIIFCFTISAIVTQAQTNIVWSDGLKLFVKGQGGALTQPVGYDDLTTSALASFQQGLTDIEDDDTLGGKSFKTTATTNSANDHLTFIFQTPHSRKKDSALYPHLHFMQTNADQTNCWFIYYRVMPLGSNNVTYAFSGAGSNVMAYTSGTMHQLANFPVINGSNVTISSKIVIKLHRDGTKGTGAITATDFDIHVQKDGLGSDTEYSKSY
jgi:hypothetical protein